MNKKAKIISWADPRLLRFPHKTLRSKIIAQYVRAAGIKKVIIFSSGNASRELGKQADKGGFDLLAVVGEEWYTNDAIARRWPAHFDATSGHLPLWLMVRIAGAFKAYLGRLPKRIYHVPTGSGETIACLKIAYPKKRFIAHYNLDSHTKRESGAPLNDFVEAIFDTIK